jgi:hypothetical protein
MVSVPSNMRTRLDCWRLEIQRDQRAFHLEDALQSPLVVRLADGLPVMNELIPANVHQFLKRYPFRGARLRRFRVNNVSSRATSAEVRLTIRASDTAAPVRLLFQFDGVEEFRFQRRPGPGLVHIKDIQIGFFGSLTYVNFDPFAEDGPPKVMDFRASDSFIAARSVRWIVVEKPTA